MLLIEPSLPGRYYLPPTSVLDWSLLSTSPTTTRCPYKGEAKYVVRRNKRLLIPPFPPHLHYVLFSPLWGINM
jgi:hypothetical protein